MTNKWTIYKEFHFSAAHQLSGLPEGHQCGRLHGHNYVLAVRLTANRLAAPGFVLDYGDLTFVKYWADHLDHQDLNEKFRFNPTSERICEFLYQVIYRELKVLIVQRRIASEDLLEAYGSPIKLEVGLSETPKTWAWYTEED